MPEAYVHRIGRTARAGAGGIAVSLVCDDERSLLRDIQKLIRITLPAFDRRNDRGLGALAAVQKSAMPEPAEGKPVHGRGAPPKSSRNRRRGRQKQPQDER